MTAEPGTIQVEKPGTIQVEKQKTEVRRGGGSPDTVYGLGLIGAWVYYIGRAETWPDRALGFAKGLVWPAFMVYAVLKFLEKK
jgi:hypothetical protein